MTTSVPGVGQPWIASRSKGCVGWGESRLVKRRLGPLGDTGRVFEHFHCWAVAYRYGRPDIRRRYCFDVHVLPGGSRFLRFSFSSAWVCKPRPAG